MKILVDTNVILDVLLTRDPFVSDSVAILHMCEEGLAEGMVTTKTLLDTYYFMRKFRDEQTSREAIKMVLRILKVCDVTCENVLEALKMDNGDLEDGVQAACAKTADCRRVITRNTKHFENTGIKTRTPEQFVF